MPPKPTDFNRLIEKRKRKALAVIAAQGLVSVMNDTKWRELVEGVRAAFPDEPPSYQIKTIGVKDPEPSRFEASLERARTSYDSWTPEELELYFDIEWINVSTFARRRRGGEVENVESDLLAILKRHAIPFEHLGTSIKIYGHAPPGLALAR